MEDSLNDVQEHKLDTSRSSASEEATNSPRVPFALHINTEDKENDKGDDKATTPKSGQSKSLTKKPRTPTESAHHALRAPYAQPILDASKKSTVGERIAVAKERRLQQQKQLVLGWDGDGPELEFKTRLEKGDQAYAKYMQTKEDKRRQIEENRAKEDQHRKEVEMRKKQVEQEEKKKAEAKIARTEQAYEVKMRQKRSTSTDRGGVKRWSWGAGADGDDGQKSASQMNLTSPSLLKTSTDRFSKSPLLINSPHMAFASGLRSYDSKGPSPGRSAVSPGLTEPVTISPRLLAPTRASLARSRNAINEIDDSASQSSGDSRSHGPMRSRSKDRRSPAATARPQTTPRSDSGKAGGSKTNVDKKSAPMRSSLSPMVPNRRPPSPAKLATPTASSETRRSTPSRSATELSKPKQRGVSPQPRTLRAPSPSTRSKQADTSQSTPIRTTPIKTTPKRQPSPSPVPTRTKTKAQNESPKPASTPPNIKPSLRPASANQTKPKTPSTKAAATKPSAAKNKTEPKPIKKPAEKKQNAADKSEKDSGYQDVPKPKEEIPTSTSGSSLSVTTTSGALSKSASDTSQDVSEIPKLEAEEEAKVTESAQIKQNTAAEPLVATASLPNDEQPAEVKTPEEPAKETAQIPQIEEPASQVPELGQPQAALPEINQQNPDLKADHEPPRDEDNVSQPVVDNSAVTAQVLQEGTSSGQNQDDESPTTETDIAKETGDSDIGKETGDADIGQETGDADVLHDVDVAAEDIQPDSLTSFQTVEPVDPRAVSPVDSLEDVSHDREEIPQSQSLRAELGFESLDVPQPDSFDDESDESEDLPSVKENKPELKEITEEYDGANEDLPEDGAKEQVAMGTIQKDEEEKMEKMVEQDDENQAPEVLEPSQPEDGQIVDEISNQQPAEVTKPDLIVTQELTSDETSTTATEPEPAPESEVTTPEVSKEEDVKDQTPVEGTQNGTERKSAPRKNLETDEEKEAYRQAIAEKRRELKEKKEQEERERQERIRLAKIEQAKREEEARRMFEEAEAAAEKEKKLQEEREKLKEEEERKQQEEEKKKEEEANARKREAAEKMRRDRELHKQKQEDERLARKKRLEMIMRRTRQPDASNDSAKSKNDDSASPLGTPSPQQSPASGRSPQNESPVGGKSPLTAGTPERSISPAVAAIFNRSSDSLSTIQASDERKETSAAVNLSASEPNLLNFTNSATKYDQSGVELIKIDAVDSPQVIHDDKPVPFEAFAQKNIMNGVEDNSHHNGSDNADPFGIFTNGSQPQQEIEAGSQDLLNLNNDVLQQKIPTEPLVPTGI